MATLTYEIWEEYAKENGIEARVELEDDYWENFISSLTKEWPKYKMSDNDEQRFYSKEELEKIQIEKDLLLLCHRK